MKAGPRKDTEAVTVRPVVKVPAAVVNDLVSAIRGQFLPDCPEKKFFSNERPLLVKAVTFPAWFLNNKSHGATLPWRRYQEIIFGVMTTIKRHGQTDRVGSFGRYFLTAIQRHMEKHWEDYYVESKSTANRFEAELSRLGTAAVQDTTVADLAALHTATSAKGGRKKRVAIAPAGIQTELF